MRLLAALCVAWVTFSWPIALGTSIADSKITVKDGDIHLTAKDIVFALPESAAELRASRLVDISVQVPELATRVARHAHTIAATANLIDTSVGPRMATLEAQIAEMMGTMANQAALVDRLLGEEARAKTRIRNLELRLEVFLFVCFLFSFLSKSLKASCTGGNPIISKQ